MKHPSDNSSSQRIEEDGDLSDFDHPDLKALQEHVYLTPGFEDDVLAPDLIKREVEAGHAIAPIADSDSISREPVLARFKRQLAAQKDKGAT